MHVFSPWVSAAKYAALKKTPNWTKTKPQSDIRSLTLGWGEVSDLQICVYCLIWSLKHKGGRCFHTPLWITWYSLVGSKAKKPLHMPTWMLQYQLRQAMHACCLPVLLLQLRQAPTILEHGDTWGPANPSRISSQDNGKSGSVSWALLETA